MQRVEKEWLMKEDATQLAEKMQAGQEERDALRKQGGAREVKGGGGEEVVAKVGKSAGDGRRKDRTFESGEERRRLRNKGRRKGIRKQKEGLKGTEEKEGGKESEIKEGTEGGRSEKRNGLEKEKKNEIEDQKKKGRQIVDFLIFFFSVFSPCLLFLTLFIFFPIF
jgi:hypothetical protein